MFQRGCRVLQSWGIEKHLEGVGGFSRFVKYEVGEGSKIRLWYDLWYETRI